MSKSLGNVLDPFEVIEVYGTDALRFYCFREVSFGQDGSISTAGFESRYETELANDFGNLASRVLAMIDRYRDGVVPEGAEIDPGPRRRRGRARRDRGPRHRAPRPDRDHPRARGLLGRGAAAEPLRRGAQALGAGQGRGRRRPTSTGVLYNLAEGLRVVTLLLHPYVPAVVRRCCSRRSPRTRARSRRSDRAAAGRGSSGSRRCSRSWRRRDRQPRTSRSRAAFAERPSWSPRPAGSASTGSSRSGSTSASNREAIRAAHEFEGVFAGRRPPPELGRRASTTRRRQRSRSWRPTTPSGRSARPGLDYYRDSRLGGGSGPRLRGADRDRAADAAAARHPRPRLERTGRRAAPSPTASSCSPPRPRAST